MSVHSKAPYQAPRGQYSDYYHRSQFGRGAFPAFGGSRHQRGHGIGSFLSGLFRSVTPLFKSASRTAGKHLISSGLGVASDLLDGHSLKKSVTHRARTAGRSLLKRALASQNGYKTNTREEPPVKRRATAGRKRRGRVTQKGRGSTRKKTCKTRRVRRNTTRRRLF